jgi:hypothetical protein
MLDGHPASPQLSYLKTVNSKPDHCESIAVAGLCCFMRAEFRQGDFVIVTPIQKLVFGLWFF